MKKTLLFMLLPVLLVAGCMREAQEPPEGGLYKRYASQPKLSVAQVSGFSLNDSVRVDVVLLQAEDDEAWQRMTAEFAIGDTAGVTSWLGDIDEPSTRVKWDGQPVLRVIASHERHAVGLYRIGNEAEYDALIDYQLNKLKTDK